jgi:DNA topoisomerase-1
MPYKLVIVESPAKSKTIEKFLGKEFKVCSSFGHIRDLPKKKLSIDLENNFNPFYEVPLEKKKVVDQLKSFIKDASKIYLASDDDREGESISWHIKETLDIDDSKIERIVFREITKNAVLNSIKNPRKIDQNLVDSQQARRLLDRIVGYYVSPILWKKIKKGLSAGRVQSVAVRMIVEREREINKFNSNSYFQGNAIFTLNEKDKLDAEFIEKIENFDQTKDFLSSIKNSKFFVKTLEKKQTKKSSSAPFTTSTLQQEASNKLGFSVSETMLIAQKLYENGKITYMRTDSTEISSVAIEEIKKTVCDLLGENYFQKKTYKKSELSQQAHEAIRPTDFSIQKIDSGKKEQKLYELIWKKTVASQMSDAIIEKNIVNIEITNSSKKLKAEGNTILFDGFLKIYNLFIKEKEGEDQLDDEKILPNFFVGQELILENIFFKERFTRAPLRYTEASLVKNLEEKGIGRPSTYAPTIQTIQKRGYVSKEDIESKNREIKTLKLDKQKNISEDIENERFGSEKQKLLPTAISCIVNDFLLENFSEIIDYDFTANLEKELDEIAEGKINWVYMLKNFFENFIEKIKKSDEIKKESIFYQRYLGNHPEENLPIFVKIGKFGPYIQMGENSEKKPRYCSIKKDQILENITLENAISLLRLPINLGKIQEFDVILNKGKFGPYILYEEKFYSIPKDRDIFSIDLEAAFAIINSKKKEEEEKIIKIFSEDLDLKIQKGRWGAYIFYKKKNYKIDKNITNPENLSYADCLDIVEKKNDKKI